VRGARSKWNDNLWRGAWTSTANSKASSVLEDLYYFSFLCVLCTADIDLHSSAEIEDLAARFGVGTPTLQHIIDGLRQPTDHDIRVSKYTLWKYLCSHMSFSKHLNTWRLKYVACSYVWAWLWQDRVGLSFCQCMRTTRQLCTEVLANLLRCKHVWYLFPPLLH